jgi:tetratricopeptide (TPR) repeat protein
VEHGTGPTLAHARHRLGKTYWDLGRLKHAAAELTEALNLVRTYGVAITESEILIDLGAVHRDSGHLDKATALVNEGLTLAVTTNERYQHARALDGLASIHDRAGRATEAEDLWRRAYALFAELGTPEAIRIRARLRSSRSAEVRT